MQKTISQITTKFYQNVSKPLLFKLKPDGVHERLLSTGNKIQNAAPARWLLNKSWAYQNKSLLGQELLGVKFDNPIGLSAGFDKNFELPPLLKSIGFGFMEGGSVTFEPCDGNPRPWFYRLPKTKSLVVYAGLANQGVKIIIDRIKSYPTGSLDNFPLNISVAKTNSQKAASEAEAIADYIGSLKLIQKHHVGAMVTLNISCPNTYGGEPFTTPQKLENLLKQVDRLNLKQPVFIKMPSNLEWSEFDKLLDVATKHKIAGVTICNLAKDRKKLKLHDELPDNVPGNLSGKPTWELSNKLIQATYKKYKNHFIIIGVGGVFSAEDAYTKIKLGATLVELITGMIFEGPQLIGQINHGLAELLQRDGYQNIKEAIGVDA